MPTSNLTVEEPTITSFNISPFVTLLFDDNTTENTNYTQGGTSGQTVVMATILSAVILVVIAGNTLVILAIITTRRLRTVTNCFVMSLAIADWLVGTCVMPLAVAYALMGSWELGWILCDLWLSLDILVCTASILSLCAISVDRYLAVTQPLTYSRRRRSKRLALGMILIVWLSSALITCPPMFGWYEPGRHKNKDCRYNKNTGYVIYSAMGSFFIPMAVMLYVYVKISCVVAQRHDQLAHIDSNSVNNQSLVLHAREESDMERGSSECEEQIMKCSVGHTDAINHNNQSHTPDVTLKPCTTPTNTNTNSNHRTLRPTISYSYRSPSVYRSGSTKKRGITLEPAVRVSSFRRETKTAQTLSIVMGGFIACWLPFFIFYLLSPFLQETPGNKLIMMYLTWLGWINSAINPFIYAFYSPDFRIAFWRLTVKHFQPRSRGGIGQGTLHH